MQECNTMEKVLPHNIEAEQGVLGSIILDPESVAQVIDFLAPTDFYRDAHRTIYATIMYLYSQHEPADFITLCDMLERTGSLENVGGPSYISSLLNEVPTSGHIAHYGHIVERTSILRQLIHAAGQIAALAYEQGVEAQDALRRAEEIVFRVGK